jgi:hypothetical protein
LDACLKCLKPGGILVVAVPLRDGFIGKAINNALNMPPHHVTHWSENTLRKLAVTFDLECIAINFEPIADLHIQWVYKIIAEMKLREILRMKPKIVDLRWHAWVISKIATLVGLLRFYSINGYKGHTVTAVYRKLL